MSALNILLIDDNCDLADGLGMLMEMRGHQVTIAYNGNDGMNAFAAGKFDVVLIDFKLPDINGLEVSREIHRKDPEIKDFLMTGFRIEQMLEQVTDNRGVDIIRKPFDNEQVLGILGQNQDGSIILVVDAEPDCARHLSGYLTAQGVKSLLAHNSQQAIDGVLCGDVEVLLLDLRMPVTDGLKVYQELKQQGRAVKTIIVTGHTEEESETADVLRSVSVTGCLFKPVNPEEFLRTLDRL